jgi:hypothetical protein
VPTIRRLHVGVYAVVSAPRGRHLAMFAHARALMASPIWALLLALAAADRADHPAAQPPNLATSVLIHDPAPDGARCLDGTPPRIWVQKSSSPNPANRTKWYWHFQGGGWCESQESCTERAFNPGKCMLGSSREACFDANSNNVASFKKVMDFLDLPAVNGARWGGGLLNNSVHGNPLAHDWNKVLMMYWSVTR